MDDQNQQTKPLDRSAPDAPAGSAIFSADSVPLSKKPELHISDSEAQSILALNNLTTSAPTKAQLPVKLILAIVALIVFAIITSYLLGAVKPGSSTHSSPSGTGSSNQTTSTAGGNNATSQINQDVKSCSNPLKAATVC
jgi:hypothetical protein